MSATSHAIARRVVQMTVPIVLVAASMLGSATYAAAFDLRSGLLQGSTLPFLFEHAPRAGLTSRATSRLGAHSTAVRTIAEVHTKLAREPVEDNGRIVGARILRIKLRFTEKLRVRLRIFCHGCTASALLRHGTTQLSKVRGQVIESKATLIIVVSTANAYGRYIEIPNAGHGGERKEPELCVSPHKFGKIACPGTSKVVPPPPTPPKDNAPPQVHGGVKVGDELSCYEGEWTGAPKITLTVQWLREGAPIPGAMESTYHVQAADRGTVVACHVTATNAAGPEYATSVGVPIPQLPENTGAPGVLGTRRVDDTLTCSSGTWSGNPESPYLYQWERGGVPILGATSETYVVEVEDEGHMLSCEVTATNAAGPVASISPEVPVDVRPASRMPPGVLGTRRVGDTLTCSSDTWSGTQHFTEVFKWERDGTAILNADKETYVVESQDEGHTLSCVVMVENEAGSASATSPEVPVRVRPASEVAPGVLGTRRVGDTLTCSKGTWSGTQDFTYRYHWERNGTSILGATKETYVVQSEDEGHTLSCMVTAENEAGLASATSEGVFVPVLPENTVAPGISGGVKVGDTLTCSKGSWSGTMPLSYFYQWDRAGSALLGATKETYVVDSEDEGHALSCVVAAENGAGTTRASSALDNIPVLPENTVSPTITGGLKAGDALTCSKGTWTGTPTLDYTYEWLRAAAAIPGATSDIYEVHGEDEGHTLTCDVTATNAAGFARATSSGLVVPNEAKKRQEEEAAANKKQEEETKAHEEKERHEKEEHTITSVDSTKGDLAPYEGIFEVAYQPFVAQSDRITYAGVTIGNPKVPAGNSSYEVTLKVCTVPECEESGSELGSVEAHVNNYGLSAAEFEGGVNKIPVEVTPGHTYYLVWRPPAEVEGTKWLAFWHSGEPHVHGSQEMEAIVRGYNHAEGGPERAVLSYLGTHAPPAPYTDVFEYAFQNFKAASNKITKLGVVVGNPLLPRGAESSEKINVRLCEAPDCEEGKIWSPAHEPFIVNYNITEATIDAEVTPGQTYFVNWQSPAPVNGERWVTYWFGPTAKLEHATATQAFAKGFDEGSLTYKPTYFKERPETGGIATFSDYENASGPGPEIGASETVEVTCKVFAPEIESVEPEGFWYRVHTEPWDDKYYAAANPFVNGGRIGEPAYSDPNVPEC
jgi:hypothetical protein